jgi:hypothetical protein
MAIKFIQDISTLKKDTLFDAPEYESPKPLKSPRKKRTAKNTADQLTLDL